MFLESLVDIAIKFNLASRQLKLKLNQSFFQILSRDFEM